ncbi:NAD(P)-binding Rossmann-fold superfamily protein [Rhynchospora pubera]|uniref:NAD(P)-binding Rossmann-fold superfamily protein n=1 Tax=Rhynchospora pubera TaxID=906938 RepID=A0AAV8DMH0_9POAL|nr:NAD(P)-binding Rossmann-fold superfamily protein [Rhynchospora pubera]
MKVLLTGASGFLGRRLYLALVAEGYSVCALVWRNDPTRGAELADGLEVVYGDITDLESLVKACDGCEALFHVAALVEPWVPDPSRFYTVNVGGIENVLKAFAKTGTMKKLIYTSSFFAIGPTDGTIADEKQLIERFNWRLPGYIGYGHDKSSFVHVDDVANGHIAALRKGKLGERYLLTGQNASLEQILDMAAAITKTSKPYFHIPLWLVEIYGWISVFFSWITGTLPLVSYPAVRALRHHWAYSCEKAKRELGYNPRSLNEGLTEMLSWLKSLKKIKY